MATIKASDVKAGDKLLIDGTQYLVLSNTDFRPGKGQATNVLLLLDGVSGLQTEMTFASDTLLELLP